MEYIFIFISSLREKREYKKTAAMVAINSIGNIIALVFDRLIAKMRGDKKLKAILRWPGKWP